MIIPKSLKIKWIIIIFLVNLLLSSQRLSIRLRTLLYFILVFLIASVNNNHKYS